MPRKGVNRCPRCHGWNCMWVYGEAEQKIALCPHCQYAWKTRAKFLRHSTDEKEEEYVVRDDRAGAGRAEGQAADESPD